MLQITASQVKGHHYLESFCYNKICKETAEGKTAIWGTNRIMKPRFPFIVLLLGTHSACTVYLWLHHQAATELHRDDLIFKKKHSVSKFQLLG